MASLLFLGMFYGLYIASVYKTTAQNSLSDLTLTFAGAIGSVCNGSSRIAWAALQDAIGFRRVYFLLLSLQLVVSATIYHVKDNEYLYIIWVACSFLCEGGHFSCFPAACVKIFGIQHGGQIFTIMFFAIPISSLASFFIV